MRWLSQVGHVAAKDLRQSRLVLALFLVAVVMATLDAVLPNTIAHQFNSLGMSLVVLAGAAAAAILVQADSPSRSDALWATRPLEPSAVLAAKFALVATLVVGLPALGEIFGLVAFGVSSTIIPGIVRHSLADYGIWLLIAMILAALTADFRSFIIAMVAVVILLFVAQALLGIDRVGERVPVFVPLLGATLGVGLLGYLYRRHDAPRTTWIVGAVAVVASYTFLLLSSESATARPITPPSDQARLVLTESAVSVQDRLLILNIRADNALVSRSLTFIPDTVLLRLRDGSRLQLVPRSGPVVMHVSGIPGAPHARQMTFLPDLQSRSSFAVVLTDEQRLAVMRGVSAIEVAGRMSVQEPRITASIPLVVGASVSERGSRNRILSVQSTADSMVVVLEQSTVAGAQRPFIYTADPDAPVGMAVWPRFAAVNAARGEAVSLENRNSSGGAGWIVLPGASVQDGTLHLVGRRDARFTAPFVLDAAWYQGAKLLIIDWIPWSGYRVHARSNMLQGAH